MPTDGSKALETSHNYARNVRICQEITEELGFEQLKKIAQEKLRYVEVSQLEAQKFIHLAIKEALKKKCNTPEDMERQLKEKGIECKYTVEEEKLKYSSYSYQGVPIKGQDVGFTAKQLQGRLDSSSAKLVREQIAQAAHKGKQYNKLCL